MCFKFTSLLLCEFFSFIEFVYSCMHIHLICCGALHIRNIFPTLLIGSQFVLLGLEFMCCRFELLVFGRFWDPRAVTFPYYLLASGSAEITEHIAHISPSPPARGCPRGRVCPVCVPCVSRESRCDRRRSPLPAAPLGHPLQSVMSDPELDVTCGVERRPASQLERQRRLDRQRYRRSFSCDGDRFVSSLEILLSTHRWEGGRQGRTRRRWSPGVVSGRPARRSVAL